MLKHLGNAAFGATTVAAAILSLCVSAPNCPSSLTRAAIVGGDGKSGCRNNTTECDHGNEECTGSFKHCDMENPSPNNKSCIPYGVFACDEAGCPQATPPDPKPDEWKPGVENSFCVN